MILGHDGHGIAKFAQDSKAAPSNFELSLYGLVGIGDAAHGDELWLPLRRHQFPTQQLRSVAFYENAGLKIQARRESEVFVGWASVAIDTAVLTPSIRVQAVFETHIGAVISGNDALAAVVDEFGRRPEILAFEFFWKKMDGFEPIAGIVGRTSPTDRAAVVMAFVGNFGIHLFFT